ncbi:MAG: hypothetical protein ACFE96_13600 [Candidatus Hermodarchaeota archaeon]
MNFLLKRNKKLLTFLALLTIFTVNAFISNLENYSSDSNDINTKHFVVEPRKTGIPYDNTYEAIGTPWNITHWANRTDYDLIANFGNNSNDMVDIPLDSDWTGHNLEASIYNLYDSRNWNNGTFHFGSNNTYATGANDSLFIANRFQNWTFQENDAIGYNNVMSGNYLDENSIAPVNTQNHDSLELRMDGSYHYSGGDRYRYDTGDKCSWVSTIHIPRGRVIDSWLKFQVNPIHIISFNSWEFRFFINGEQVFSEGLFTLKQRGQNQWHSFTTPQGLWINTSNVYSTNYLNDSTINIEVALEYTATSASYGFEDGENTDYQQVIVDNIELITKAEAQPSDVKLKVNNTVINDVNWGEGTVEIEGDWQSSNGKLYATFSSDDIGELGAFDIDLLTNLNLHARKDSPESNYETNVASLGVNFEVDNGSNVNWQCYGKVEVPTRYEETELKIYFPSDVIITSVYEPQNPVMNVLSQCDNSTPGVLSIPVNTISATPDGFWNFEAISPNYCQDLTIYHNTTGVWVEGNEILSGSYVNLTAKISNTPEISSYIQSTNAQLRIRFPNGSIWSDQNQISSVDSNGNIFFNLLQIPSNSPNYEVGEYEAIVTWNNSYSGYSLNETGIIIGKFRIVHESDFVPDYYFYEDIIEDSTFNLKVSFSDSVNGNPITSAAVYTYNYTHPTIRQHFSEISPGYYFLEFNVGGGSLGNNSLLIYANSSNYLNKVANITIKLIRETELTVDNDFINDVPFEQNFTIQLIYTEKDSGIGVNAETLSTDWTGNHQFIWISQGVYNLTCSSIGNVAGQLYSLNIYVDSYEYEAKSIEVKVFITELKSSLDLLVNNTPIQANDIYTVDVRESLNITVFFNDIFSNPLSGAIVNITGGAFSYFLNEVGLYNQYTIVLNATDLGQGIDNLNIFAQLVNYEPQSIPFIVQIREKLTNLQIMFDEVDVTNDPTIDIITSQDLNITVKYLDENLKHIQGALIQLSGDYNGVLLENLLYEQYTFILDTAQIAVGVRIISLSATKANFQLQTENLRINVQRIRTNITTISGSSIITVQSGIDIHIQVRLFDLDFGGTITDANVTYRWQFGEGDIIEIGSTGTYEAILPSQSVGSYTLTITASKGDLYDFQRYEITITITRPPDDFWIFIILLITASIIAIALTSYLILYKKVLQYPKQVRKVRKYERSLKKTRDPRVDITARKDLFEESFKDEIEQSGKYLKGKPSESSIHIDKIEKQKSLEIPNIIEKDGGANLK